MMIEVSGATPVDCAVAAVVAAVSDASEPVRRLRVALRVPETTVLLSEPEAAAGSDGGSAESGTTGELGGKDSRLVPFAAVHAATRGACYVELSSLAAAGEGSSLRMRELGGSQQQDLHDVVAVLSSVSTNASNCSSDSKESSCSPSTSSSCHNAGGLGGNKCSSSCFSSCSSPGLDATARQDGLPETDSSALQPSLLLVQQQKGQLDRR
ncbi:ubiquitin carboxyl-terminal [Cyclospora cayetanensis]|uniref:Ubiquitin carboxyl-terminal n=1 Tax=Cyclospora cayetanensis TaxID=88456 RepID=A0A1D3CZM6_9EIME|nr:ubiquitin carboxyl-terminal [Cyclospora cayetanensis]